MDEYLVDNTPLGYYYKIPDENLVSRIKLTELTEKTYNEVTITDEIVDNHIKCESYKNNNLNLLETIWVRQDLINTHLQAKLEAKINNEFTIQDLSGVYPPLVKQEDYKFTISLNPFVKDNIQINYTKLDNWNGSCLSIGSYISTDNKIKFTIDGLLTSTHKSYKDFVIRNNESSKYLINAFKQDILDIFGDIQYFANNDKLYFYSENNSILYYTKQEESSYNNEKELKIIKTMSKNNKYYIDHKEDVSIPMDTERVSSSMMWEIIYNKHKDFFNLIEEYEKI